MRIIKTQQDFDVLQRVGALPETLLDQVEDYFNQLKVELEDDAGSGRSAFVTNATTSSSFLQSESTVRSAYSDSIDTSDTFLSRPWGASLGPRCPRPPK